ncbi:MAG: hypothetical protein NTV51_19000 [Verrucomicrobia bacterium]|nr:hypothetical protein [Verrucomicrobiota bacterium]
MLAVLGLAGAAGLVLVHLDNVRLRVRVADLRRGNAQVRQLQEENRRVKELVARTQADAQGAGEANRAEIARVTREIAELEKRAAERHAALSVQANADAAAMASNRDLRQGLVRLEHCQNVGRATPTAAFETLVWAAMTGDEATLAQLLRFSPAARAKAEAWLAGLPPETRAQWTVEKLGGLFYSNILTAVSALQVTGESVESDGESAVVGLRLAGSGGQEKVKFKLGPNGWQVAVSEGQFDSVRRRINGLPVSAGKK